MYGQRKTVFAFFPIARWVHVPNKEIYRDGSYWWRRVTLMRTIWNGWTAYASDNDVPNGKGEPGRDS